MIALYLDDVRNPPEVKDITWVVARSYQEAVDYVGKNGIPPMVSFDHDLGDNVPSGHDFAKWLVNQHLDGNITIPKDWHYEVHSANPPGARNIRGLLDNFLEFLQNDIA